MAKARILIVEDESIIALDLSGILRGLGYEVSGIVPSGTKAVEDAVADPPDLILMDIISSATWTVSRRRAGSGAPATFRSSI